MSNAYFQFKQFTIQQERCAMKVGTDGVLLGAWASLETATSILDIGTGSGLIALMAAQRNSRAQIHAIEIDPLASCQAKENISRSRWKERIKVFQGAIQNFQPHGGYDAIVCNPPFFIHSTPNPSRERTRARHCTDLSHEDLFQAVKRLLLPGGKFSTILPALEANQFMEYIQAQQWFIHRLTHVYPTPYKSPKRYLLEISPQQNILSTSSLIIEIERHHYHESYKTLTRDFYLNF